jgi:hypothetical protein
MVMVVEPFMVVPLFMRPGHPLKIAGGTLFTAFHLFILVTLGLPFAMFGLLSTTILFFGPELTARAARWSTAPLLPPLQAAVRVTRAGRLALAFLVVLALATTRHVPVVGAFNVPAYGLLWMVGVAQDYRLFNWIDRVNYDVVIKVAELGPDGAARSRTLRAMSPSSFRAKLLIAYLHDVRWLRLPAKDRLRTRTSIAERLAGWYCRHNNRGESAVRVTSDIFRLVPSGRSYWGALMVAEFSCHAGRATIRRTLESPPRPG